MSLSSLDWIALFEAFGEFQFEARRHGLYGEQLEQIENDIMARNPIPQPKKMEV